MFEGSFQGVSLKEVEGLFSEDLSVFRVTFTGIPREFQGYVKEFHRVFQGIFRIEEISKRGWRVFQECFTEVLFCNFIFAWRSLQLPEQKGGLFYGYCVPLFFFNAK